MRGMTETMTIGERVVLAGLVGRTEDWLSRIENNKIELDRLSVIRSLSDALDVTLGDLVAEPALLDWTTDSGVRTVPALRAVLMNYGLAIPALATDADEPPSLDDVQRDIGEIFDAYQASRYGYVTGRAPLVLSDTLRAARSAGADEPNRANALLALAYQSAVSVLTKLGETDLAWIASERGLNAAQQADNPVVLGSLFRCVAHAVHSTGRFQDGVRLVQSAANVLEPQVGSRAEDALISVYGTLFLTGAVAAARADDRQAATAFLAEATDCAGRLGRDANSMWTAFGPTNVAIHRMTAAMELGDVQIAVDLAPRIDATGLPTERRVRHAIETARAYTARNRRDDALGVLLDAEQLAPEQIRHHAISRQLVLSWLRNNRGARSVALEQLAGRLRLA
jgi:transcriptional regulator with XRE-family HTH domain